MPTVTIGENTGDDYGGSIDSWIDSSAPDANYGTTSQTFIASSKSFVVSFSGLSNISSGASVSASSVYIRVSSGGVGEGTITTRVLLKDWTELQVTWNDYVTSTPWTTAGAKSDGNDRVGAASTSRLYTDSDEGVYVENTSSQLASDVEDWINGTLGNYGLLFEMASGFCTFVSSEFSDGTRPYLSVTYTTGGASFTLTAADSYELSDTLTQSASAISTQSDSLILSDSQSSTVSALLGMSDGVSFGDQDQGIADLIAQLSDSYVFSDIASLAQSQDFDLTLSDGLTWSDSFGAIAAVSLTLSDGYEYSDASQLIAQLALSCVDGYVISDTFFTGEPVEGPIKISVQTKQGVIDFVIKKTVIGTTVKQPIINTETE